MDLKLTGKTALVTGSTAGIGLAIAQSLAREVREYGSMAGALRELRRHRRRYAKPSREPR